MAVSTSCVDCPGVVSPLRVRGFRWLFVGRVLSSFGDSLVPLTVAFAALELTGSVVGLGGVLLANRLPVVVATLAGGVLGDVFDRRWVMVAADVWRMASQAVCGALLLAGQLPLWALIVLQGCAGVGTAVFTPAATGLLPALVPENLLRQANALLGLAANVNKVAAISVAGLLVAGLGSGWALLADAATFAGSALSLLLIGPVTTLAGKRGRRGVLGEMWGGWRHVAVTPWLRTLLGYTALLQALVIGPHMLLGPLLARQHYHGAASWAVIGAVQAIGSIAGSALALRLRPSRPLVAAVAASLLMLPYLALFAAAAPLWLVSLAALGFGLQGSYYLATQAWLLQRHVPDQQLARVASCFQLGNLVLVPLSLAAAGPLAEHVDARLLLATTAVWALASTLVALAAPTIRAHPEAVQPGSGAMSTKRL
ncbi:MFS transporter [Actinopolyspora sp. H202]|uniref:MFS transporter n=1 Tax=Actinopolyspora sp. H202 TaxID=1500456 RepID=UPI003EE71ADB